MTNANCLVSCVISCTNHTLLQACPACGECQVCDQSTGQCINRPDGWLCTGGTCSGGQCSPVSARAYTASGSLGLWASGTAQPGSREPPRQQLCHCLWCRCAPHAKHATSVLQGTAMYRRPATPAQVARAMGMASALRCAAGLLSYTLCCCAYLAYSSARRGTYQPCVKRWLFLPARRPAHRTAAS